MTHDSLPLLIVHGDLVWMALAVVMPVASVFGVWCSRRRALRRRTEDTLCALGPVTSPSTFRSGHPAVVEGILRMPKGDGERGWSTVLAHGALPKPDEPSTIDVAGAGIEGVEACGLEGSAELLWGSDVQLVDGRLTSSLGDGDRVRIRGRLEAAPKHDHSEGYRRAAIQWHLGGEPDRRLQMASAVVPSAKLGISAVLGAMVVGVLAFAAGTGIVGAWAMKSASDAEATLGDDGIDYPVSVQVAAAMPFHRADALELTGYILSYRDVASDEATRAEMQVHVLRGDCPAATMVAIYHNQLGLAAERLRDCPDTGETRNAAFELYGLRGDFAKASEVGLGAQVLTTRVASTRDWSKDGPPFERSWTQVAMVHVLAGEFARAAAILDAEADDLQAWAEQLGDTPSDSGVPSAQEARERAKTVSCLAASAAIMAGEGERLDTLRTSAATDSACRIVFSHHAPDAEVPDSTQERAEGTWNYVWTGDLPSIAVDLAAGRIDEPWKLRCASCQSNYSLDTLLTHHHLPSYPLAMGLIGTMVKTLEGQPEFVNFRAELLVEQAFWEAAAGDLEQAHQLANEADAQLRAALPAGVRDRVADESFSVGDPGDPYYELIALLESPQEAMVSDRSIRALADVRALRAVLALKADDVGTAAPLLEQARRLGGDLFDDIEVTERYSRRDLLAGRIPKDEIVEQMIEAVGMYEPDSLEPGRVRNSASPPYFNMNGRIVSEMMTAGELAHRLGNAEWEREARESAERWMTALSDPDRSLLVSILYLL